MERTTTILAVLLLMACGGSSPPPAETTTTETSGTEAPPPPPPTPAEQAPVAPIAWTEHPEIASAPPGPVRGNIDGADVVMQDVGISLTGRVWSLHLAEHADLGAAEVIIPLTIVPAAGATEETHTATTASFCQTVTQAAWQGAQVGIALELTAASFTACPAGE